MRAHFLRVGKIGRRGNAVGAGRVGGIYGINVKILVAAIVLYKKNAFAVPAPEIAADRALELGGQRFCLFKRLVDTLYPDIAHVLIRFEKRNIFAVRRDLGARILRVAEKDLAVDKLRQLGQADCGERRQENRG